MSSEAGVYTETSSRTPQGNTGGVELVDLQTASPKTKQKWWKQHQEGRDTVDDMIDAHDEVVRSLYSPHKLANVYNVTLAAIAM